ncbi:hypothetical protein TKK_0017307 [Trichogramma kaykai]|uniref:ADP-ribosylation factor-like protein 13B n=1 Tax=Trichogramma kaykai TaxID=54128 RepID=A0ABD2W3D2_9HYME
MGNWLVNCIVNSVGCVEYHAEQTAAEISHRLSPRKPVVILVLGLDNAGKTSVVNYLHKKKFTDGDVLPTKGFRTVKFNYKSQWEIVLYDISGAKEFRSLWPNYYAEVHGFIYVIDADDHRRYHESEEVFKVLACHEHATYKPILFLGNKQDLENSLDRVRIIEFMHLYQIVNFARVYTRVEECSCLKDTCKYYNCNRNIDTGFEWLIKTIAEDYEELVQEIQQRQEKKNKKLPRKLARHRSWAAQKTRNPFDYSDTDSDTYLKPQIELPKPKKKLKQKKVFNKFVRIRKNRTSPQSDEQIEKHMKEMIKNMKIEELIRTTKIDENVILSYERPRGRPKKKQVRPRTASGKVKSFKLKHRAQNTCTERSNETTRDVVVPITS